MKESKYSIEEIRGLTEKALTRHNTESSNASKVAAALLAAEIDGLSGHGLSRLPSYCAQSASGKVNGYAVPEVSQVSAAAVRVDAQQGFAYPAMELAINELETLLPMTGIATAAVTNSHHCGAAGYHVESLAQKGFIGLLFANTPKAIAPWGGQHGLFGTNPIAFAVPRQNQPPLVIDLALSKVARGKIMVASKNNTEIPEGWALDSSGNATTDPAEALSGTMLPMGDAKGAALVLMVEIMAAALTGANFGFEASSFFTAEGDPPNVGQMLLAFNPQPISGDQFYARIETLIAAILNQDNTRLPGERKPHLRQMVQESGLQLSEQQFDQLHQLANCSKS